MSSAIPLARYWERGNRAEWNARSRNHHRRLKPAQEARAKAAIAECYRLLEEVGEVPRETPEKETTE